MNGPVVFFKDIKHVNDENYGNKASRLAFLYNANIPVPNGSILILSNTNNYVQVWNECVTKLQKPYILRSSFSIEDGNLLSFAGVFDSVGNINSKDEFISAIRSLSNFSNSKLLSYAEKNNIDINNLKPAFIIQEYKYPIMSGVVFSSDISNPNFLKIEYSNQPEGITSGTGEISTVIFDKTTKTIVKPINFQDIPIEKILELVDMSIRIEGIFKLPQDIEWLYDGTRLWILQSRNIITTQTISPEKNLENVYKNFDNQPIKLVRKYFAESIDFATPITVSLFKKIYSSEGALGISINHLFWSKKKINPDMLIIDILGRSYINEIYEEELLPFLYYKSYTNLLTDFIKTILKSPLSFPKKFFELLHHITVSNIFKIKMYVTYRNLLRNKKQRILRQDNQSINPRKSILNIVEFLNDDLVPKLFNYSFFQNYLYEDLKNTIKSHITEEEWNFLIRVPNSDNTYVPDPKNIYELSIRKELSIPQIQKPFYKIKIDREEIVQRLPDTWLKQMISIKLTMYDYFSNLREIFHKELVSQFIQLHNNLLIIDKNEHLYNSIWFSTIDEVIKNKPLSVQVLFDKKRLFESYRNIHLPIKITSTNWDTLLVKESVQTENNFDAIILSSFDAEGLCGTLDMLDSGKLVDVLLVENLDPSIVTYFSKIKGVITTNGGELSHASILAREFQLPVFKTVTLINSLRNKYVFLDSKNKKIYVK